MTQEYNVSTEIYALGNIQEAIKDFSDVTDISFNKGILVVTGESEAEIQEVFHEFMNYVISL